MERDVLRWGGAGGGNKLRVVSVDRKMCRQRPGLLIITRSKTILQIRFIRPCNCNTVQTARDTVICNFVYGT